MPALRLAVVGGLFYPAAPAALRAQVAGYLGRVDAADGHARAPKLLIVPHRPASTGNLYTRLHEFREMGFVLHALRAGFARLRILPVMHGDEAYAPEALRNVVIVASRSG